MNVTQRLKKRYESRVLPSPEFLRWRRQDEFIKASDALKKSQEEFDREVARFKQRIKPSPGSKYHMTWVTYWVAVRTRRSMMKWVAKRRVGTIPHMSEDERLEVRRKLILSLSQDSAKRTGLIQED